MTEGEIQGSGVGFKIMGNLKKKQAHISGVQLYDSAIHSLVKTREI